ncbi:hypothetical protein GPECTOR_22g921 [Gonium pectorale]|uniref:Alpha 1,4-glycosyltransferase domain-containing protein n=1 Tax=Gonium pectorale TaxID=33097 RepID=A0A150GHN9_GONPE|nr:hypothetical protein GPECTOR_22g921 [Gonium pectorale]|eukprot:KXZ49327.1 hypothetical protein GPECTOR_22g921 [Gonium pectorale]
MGFLMPRSIANGAPLLRARLLLAFLTTLCILSLAQSQSETPQSSPHIKPYDDKLIRELDANGERNVFLIWTTNASTFDHLARACIGSVIAIYGRRVYLFANNLTPDDLVGQNWTRANLVHYESPRLVFQGTPLDEWFARSEGKLRSGRFYFSHVTDMMRFALVYRHGGLYLDTDVYAIKPISPSHINHIAPAEHHKKFYECAVTYFTRQHPFLSNVLKHITRNYDAKDYVTAGPRAISTVYNWAPRKDAAQLPRLIDPGAWWRQAKAFWRDGKLRQKDFKGCEVVHLWGSVARGTTGDRPTYMHSEEARSRIEQRLGLLRNLKDCRPRGNQTVAEGA